MSSEIYVIGVNMTPFGKFLDRTVRKLTEAAVSNALVDAGIGRLGTEDPVTVLTAHPRR